MKNILWQLSYQDFWICFTYTPIHMGEWIGIRLRKYLMNKFKMLEVVPTKFANAANVNVY